MVCQYCTDESGVSAFPYYGVGPHTCFYKIPGAQIGQSQPLPEHEWPRNYAEDKSSPGLGFYWCPECGHGKDEVMEWVGGNIEPKEEMPQG